MADKSRYTVRELYIRDAVKRRTGTVGDIDYFGEGNGKDKEREEQGREDYLERLSKILSRIPNLEEN